MPEISDYIMDQLFGESDSRTLAQRIVGAILTDMDGRGGVVDLGHFDDEIVREMGEAWEQAVALSSPLITRKVAIKIARAGAQAGSLVGAQRTETLDRIAEEVVVEVLEEGDPPVFP